MNSIKRYAPLVKQFRLYSVLGTTQSSRQHFVPPHSSANETDVHKFKEFIHNSKRLLVITGAGISTESGIPDYRSEGVGLYARSSSRPVQYQDFVKKADMRQRYWARNFVGWPTFSSVLPNKTHMILSEWETIGNLHWLVTQNVDALHYKAGSKNLTELHGSAHRVECLDCKHMISRPDLQEMIKRDNPIWHSESVDMAPDGDVQLSQEQINGFNVPSCKKCGGVLKPEIVFFGDNVPRPRVNFVFNKVKESDSLLVLGSSLEVYSGYRFVNAAHEQKKPIAIVSIGPTRADKLANIKINTKCSEILSHI